MWRERECECEAAPLAGPSLKGTMSRPACPPTPHRTSRISLGAALFLLPRMARGVVGDCGCCFVSRQTRVPSQPPLTTTMGDATSIRHHGAAAFTTFEESAGGPSDDGVVDTRPHEQRREGPRRARRMNHAFQHLYRHDMGVGLGVMAGPEGRDDRQTQQVHTDVDEGTYDGGKHHQTSPTPPTRDGRDYLVTHGGYGECRVDEMAERFPPLLTLDVERHLMPKLRFLKYTLGGIDLDDLDLDLDVAAGSPPPPSAGPSGDATPSNRRERRAGATTSARSFLRRHVQRLEHGNVHRGTVALSPLGRAAPPEFFGARLERTVAPRHAFLVYAGGLPCGGMLLENDAALLREFLAARSSKQFASLCNRWRSSSSDRDDDDSRISAGQVDAFEALFRRGIMASVRDEGRDHMEKVGIESGTMVELLISHGANPHETDIRGVSLLHWACGAGNVGAVGALAAALGGAEPASKLTATRDGATPLHWAACGVRSKDFGCGGSLTLCRWFVENGASSAQGRKDLIDAVTKDGNSVLMWAAWSGSFEVVKFLVNNGADVSTKNRNGCTVAHWAASGGNICICNYLRDEAMVDFNVVNYGGNSPLSHAVSYGRENVVSWLLRTDGRGGDDGRAVDLAKEFVKWTEGDPERRKVLDLFL